MDISGLRRREMLAGIVAIPALGAVAVTEFRSEPHPTAVPKVTGRRASTIKGDPGERLYAEACGDGLRVKVFFNGVEEKTCDTADERDGYIIRPVMTSNGNIAFNKSTGKIYRETVFGEVRIELVLQPA